MEVLVAVGIIAIISSIAVATFQGNKKQAAEVVATTSASNVLRAHNACTALNTFESCVSMEGMGVECADCNEGYTAAGSGGSPPAQFCVGVTKTVGADSVKVCIGKKGAKVQRTIGGTLLSDIEICMVKRENVGSGTKCGHTSDTAPKPTSSFRKCDSANLPTNFCGSNVASDPGSSGNWCKITYSCGDPGTDGDCSSAGACS